MVYPDCLRVREGATEFQMKWNYSSQRTSSPLNKVYVGFVRFHLIFRLCFFILNQLMVC